MPIRLYNSLTKTKQDFAPIDPANVRMYVCGPTVYDFAHIGNARPAIVFDVLFRLLRHEYGAGHVTYARNFTDVDDKINARAADVAAATGIGVEQARAELTATTERQYLEDVRALGCLDPNAMPRATEHIVQMIAMIEKLVASGNAYPAEGHVLFDVSSKPDYGKLARRSLDEMIAGARVDVAPYKKSPMDFVLWKPSDDTTPGWDSPWGRGRPGWHIECSAMIAAKLGPSDTIDIHGGGIDLVFPHHENEIAQSEGAHGGHALANVWMHNGFLQVEGEKMSKSAGNFFTIRDLLADWPGEVLRFNMLRTHYRQPIDWTVASLEEVDRTFHRWFVMLDDAGVTDAPAIPSAPILAALSDDLNTPLMFTELHHIASRIENSDSPALRELASNLNFLGLLIDEEPVNFSESAQELINIARLSASNEVTDRDIKILAENGFDFSALSIAIELRLVVRRAKDFAESDRIRDELLSQGIVLKDGPGGTTWEVKR